MALKLLLVCVSLLLPYTMTAQGELIHSTSKKCSEKHPEQYVRLES